MPKNIILILMGMLAYGFSFGASGPVITALVSQQVNPLINACYNGLPFVMYFVATPLANKVIQRSGIRTCLLIGSGFITSALLLFAVAALCKSSIGLALTNLLVITGAGFFRVGGDTAINKYPKKTVKDAAQPWFTFLFELGIFLGSLLLALSELFPVLKTIRAAYPFIPFLVSATIFAICSPLTLSLLWNNQPINGQTNETI